MSALIEATVLITMRAVLFFGFCAWLLYHGAALALSETVKAVQVF